MVEVTGACQELWVHELNPGVFGVFPSVVLKFDIFDGICADMCPHTELALGCKTLKITEDVIQCHIVIGIGGGCSQIFHDFPRNSGHL